MKHEQFWSGFFDEKAAKESDDAKCLTFSSEANRRSIYEAIQLLVEGSFRNILDVGAGTGSICKMFGTRSSLVTAMDISYEMLKKIQPENFATLGRIDICQASVLNPPFRDSSFDLVIASEVLQYVPFLPSVRRLTALLKLKGIMVISIPHKNHPAIQRAHRRRNGLYNGIGIKELSALSEMDKISFKFMPLFLCDDFEKCLRRGKIFTIPEIENIKTANRLIIKIQRLS